MGKNIQCPKIIRTEGLDLLPMVSNFLIKYGNAISNKDTVLIGNANQLLKEGLEGYIGTLLDTVDRIAVGSRSGCTVLPAPMILIDGCADPFLLKSIMDLHAWIRIYGVDRSGSLNDAMGTIDHFIQSAKGELVQWHKQNYIDNFITIQ
jgi:hypothetical protein